MVYLGCMFQANLAKLFGFYCRWVKRSTFIRDSKNDFWIGEAADICEGVCEQAACGGRIAGAGAVLRYAR